MARTLDEKKQSVLMLLLIMVILGAIVFVFFNEVFFQSIGIIILGFAFITFFLYFDVLIQLHDYERGVVMRFGRFNRITGPGWFFLLPFIENYVKVDLRIQTVDIPPQNVITTGNIEIKVDAVVFMKVGSDIESVKASVINIEDYKEASSKYVISAIRDIVSGMPLNQIISDMEGINVKLEKDLKSISKDWGIEVQKIEIQEITIPKTILDAMHENLAAEQEKKARIHKAEAKKAEIMAVKEATSELDEKALSYYYIKALEKMSQGKATKIIFPIEVTKLANLISEKVGKGVKVTSEEKQNPEKFIEKHKEEITEVFGKDTTELVLNALKEGKKTGKELEENKL